MGRGRKRERGKVMKTALRGAAAGMAGGLAVSLAEREVLTRLSGAARHRAGWDDVVKRRLQGVGVEVGDRGAIAAGVATQLLYAGALGAVYAVLRERADERESRAGGILLDGALTYAASLVFPDTPTPPRRGHRLALRRKLVKPANPAAAFSRATTMALGALGGR